ncbi:MAG: serine hydrolase [Pseudomonadota bacterium]
MQGGHGPASRHIDSHPATPQFFDAGRIEAAVAFALANESTMDRDIGAALAGGHFSEPLPDGAILGPVRPRGDPSGVILHQGRTIARWGPVDAPDMTFSVAKSYLAIVAGLAWDDGLFGLDDPLRATIPALFDAPQNRAITWRHLLQQTSEWEGTLWTKADRIDRNRSLGTAPGAVTLKGSHRDLQRPGTFWEYNDIRVNVLSYALMQLFRRPLPDVLRERIMDPLGASDRWAWHGYGPASTVTIEGRAMESVSGGAHWGGGLFIPTTDHALVGRMIACAGAVDGTRVLSEAWVRAALTPSDLNPDYGFLWWLNANGAFAPTAPASSVFALGVGRNVIWVDPVLELVAVVRWLDRDSLDGFCAAVMAALVDRPDRLADTRQTT